jgi:hypothetical protein
VAYVNSQPVTEAGGTTLASTDDSGCGLVRFVVFSAAVLLVTGAVALLAVVGSWWILGAAFAVHVGVTAVVTFAVVHAMGGRSVAIPESGDQAVPSPRVVRPDARVRPSLLILSCPRDQLHGRSLVR